MNALASAIIEQEGVLLECFCEFNDLTSAVGEVDDVELLSDMVAIKLQIAKTQDMLVALREIREELSKCGEDSHAE